MKNSMVANRGPYRNLNVTLDVDLTKKYSDEEVNVRFNNDYLDVINPLVPRLTTEKPGVTNKKSLHSITKEIPSC